MGTRDYECTPWGMPTYNVFGWQKPCYLLQDGYADDLRGADRHDRVGSLRHRGGNPQVPDCMVHSGYEASARRGGLLVVARLRRDGARDALRSEHSRGERTQRPAAPPAPLEETPPPLGASLDATPESLRAAFRYRGDVTLVLDDGARIEASSPTPKESDVTFWPKGSAVPERIATARVRHVVFSGRDWVERGARSREAGRRRVAAAAERA